jgi:glycosyltransferase involved in cell wall biosynthesis
MLYGALFGGLYFQVFLLVSYFFWDGKTEFGEDDVPATEPYVPSVAILVPCWNEEKTVVKTVHSLLALNYPREKLRVVVIDDGSTDETIQVVKELQKEHDEILLIKNEKNIGKGASVKNGIKNANGEILIIQDADLEYDPSDYQKILEKYQNEKINVVYGSRILGAKIYNNYSANLIFYLGGITLTALVNFFLKTKITDQPTGYKSWRTEFSSEILKFCKSNQFAFEIELTGYFAKKGEKIVEVPIHYYPRTVSHGKKIGLKDFLASILMLSRVRSRKIPSHKE